MPRRDAAFRAALCSVNFGHRWLSGYYPDHRHYHQRPFRSYSYWARRPGKIWLFILFFFVLQRIEGDILYPKIVGKSVGLSEIWVLAAITVGGSLYGVLGIIVSVPVASVIAYILSDSVQKRLQQKNIDFEQQNP